MRVPASRDCQNTWDCCRGHVAQLGFPCCPGLGRPPLIRQCLIEIAVTSPTNPGVLHAQCGDGDDPCLSCRSGSQRGRLASLLGWKGRGRRRHCQLGGKGRERFGRSADAGSRRTRRCRPGESLVHDPPDGASTAPTFGTASQTPVDLARRSDGAFGCNGSNLMVRNDVARTHNHDGTPSSIRLSVCARPSAFICMMRYPCHLAVMSGKYNEVKSL
jgi:hypothetical protein